MIEPAHAAADPARPGPADLHALVASMTGPMSSMLATLGQGTVAVFQHLLDQAYEAGRVRGRAEVEHRVARQVGLPVTERGVEGTLHRCYECGGEGLVFRSNAPAPPASAIGSLRRPQPRAGEAETEVIPRLRDGDPATVLLDRQRIERGR